MRAAVMTAYGGPEVLSIVDVPPPTVGPRDVLIRVHAASINPVDTKMRRGSHRLLVPRRLPWILGLDVSGVVTEVGHRVRELSVGDEVFAFTSYGRSGTHAECVAVDASLVARKPDNLSHEQAAAFPLVGVTAWDCLVQFGRITQDSHVLIQAGSGGVGTVAIQLAKSYGAHVTTTCSARNVELVRELGADTVVDYTKESFDEVVRDCDIVLDSLGFDEVRRSFRVVRRGGAIASITPNILRAIERYGTTLGTAKVGLDIARTKVAAWRRRLRFSLILARPNGAVLAQLAELLADATIRPVIDGVFGLDDIAEAHRAIESGRTRGKNVIVVP